MKCPRCLTNDLRENKPENALSRRDNKTYICSPCGTEEALFDWETAQRLEVLETAYRRLHSEIKADIKSEKDWLTGEINNGTDAKQHR